MVFAIDVDEVLRCLLTGMVNLYNENFDESMRVDDVKDFRVDISFPRIKSETGDTASYWFFQKHGNELFAKSDAFPHIKKNINKLKEYGDVIIVTYQKSYQNKLDTLNWLQEHGLEPNGICFLKDKTRLISDYLIDDNDYNFIGSNAKHGIIISAPYNKEINLNELKNKSNCEDITRYASLDEFVKDFVKKHKNERA